MNTAFELFIVALLLAPRAFNGAATGQPVETTEVSVSLSEPAVGSAVYGNGAYVAIQRREILTNRRDGELKSTAGQASRP